MAIITYIPDSSSILHETKADFVQRDIVEYVHVVQYDKNLPLLAVDLFMDGEPYILPNDSFIKIRWGKKDHTFVYKDALGCNPERTRVYVAIDEQMSYYYGPHYPILELSINDKYAGSSIIPVFIDRNPMQETDIESTSEYADLEEAIRICSEAENVVSTLTPRVSALESGKQDTLVSGINIKTINGQTLLGSGNMQIEASAVLPQYPSTNGGYLLRLDISNGSSVLSWSDNVATFSQTEGGVTIV